MTAATTRSRGWIATILLVALAGGHASAPVRAQQTVQVEAPTELRELLARAEALLGEGEATTAYELLQGHESRHAGSPYFDYLLGVAALDSGRTTQAILSLQRAAAAARQFSGARMELARAYFDAGQSAAARPLFVALLDEQPPPGVREVIDRYIAAIDAGPARPPARLQPFAELMVGYDDNANGSTDQQEFLGFTLNPENLETDSSFFEAGAGVDWINPTSATFAWRLGARAGYRRNPDASFVDSGIVSVLAGSEWRSGALFGRAGIDAYWASRDGESNESYSGIDLLLGRNLNERWDISLGVRGGALRYDDAIEILDVNRMLYSLGLSYRFASGARFEVAAIGGNDDEQMSGSPYGNSKAGGRISVNAPVGNLAYLFASVGNLTSDYDNLFFGSAREDTQLTAFLQLEFRDVLMRGLIIAPRVRYIDNDSDITLYDYDRTELGLLIRWTP